MVEKYVVGHTEKLGKEYLMTDIGMEPFYTLERAKEQIGYFNKNGFLLGAKIYKLIEVTDE